MNATGELRMFSQALSTIKPVEEGAKFQIGDIVFLVTDPTQERRMVTSIHILPGHIMYSLSCGIDSSRHYDFEISDKTDAKTSVGFSSRK